MRFRMLGPLEVWSAEERWAGIGAAKWRSLLACLLLKPGQVVPTETLIAELWGTEPPSTANNLVSIYVHRLRGLIGDPGGEVLAHRKPGYRLRVGGEDTDLGRFEALAGQGRELLAGGDAEAAAARLHEAEDLWRGELLADVTPTILVDTESERAGELRLAVAELRAEADLRCGRHSEVVPGLRTLAAENPLREGLWLLLMRALDGAGRHAEALETYGQARTVIADELGVEPGPGLQSLYTDLLAADGPPPRAVPTQRKPAPAPRAAAPAGPALPVPAQLPADIGDFTGRCAEMSHLRAVLAGSEEGRGPGAVRIAVVAGAAGLGKTTLAVRAAHQVRELFADGQLYVDLFGASAHPLAPGDVLARFLRDLGVDGDQIPAGTEERAALYRTRLTGRRVLVMLDNAWEAAQVKPLLPGSESCAVLVTTRNRMPALASTRFVDLDMLPDAEALDLFTRIVDDVRPAAEPDATAEVLLACAGLPLAIRICAARLAARRQWKVATLASRLRDSRSRLDEMQAGNLEVRASFGVSYDALRGDRSRVDPARAFRLLGLWQGRTISLPAAAALLGEPEPAVEAVLERLVDANLLESPAPDRYQFHDLLKVYAAERAEEEEPEAERARAVERLLAWYLATAEAAAEASSPNRYRIRFDETVKVKPLDFASVEDVLDWYNGERENVVAATRQASSEGLDDVGWRLPAALLPVFNRRGNWADCLATHRIALESVRQTGNRQGEGWIEQNLGIALARTRDHESIRHLERALAIRREISDSAGEVQAALNIADAYFHLEGPREALKHVLSSLEVVRRVGRPIDHVTVLNNLGEVYLELDHLDEAADCFHQIMDLLRSINNPWVEGHAMHNLGRVYLGQGQLGEAGGALRKAVRIHRSTGDQVGEAVALRFLGYVQRGLGQPEDARNSWGIALRILGELGEMEQAREVGADLESLAANQG
ncbi:MAG: tetratricopeptide repeat protein [Streptosporangiales bacterium]|nr:tetratricopeptide repeat protein [Streptosporangiales bacterium]